MTSFELYLNKWDDEKVLIFGTTDIYELDVAIRRIINNPSILFDGCLVVCEYYDGKIVNETPSFSEYLLW